MPAYVIKVDGIEQARTRFDRMGVAAVEAQPAMEAVAGLMMHFIDQTFKSQGRRGGGSWRFLTQQWLERKARDGLDMRIGFATDALHRSLTEPEAPHQILEITPKSVNLGSDLPYAATQQRHRPYTKFTQTDRLKLRATVREYLIAAWRGTRL